MFLDKEKKEKKKTVTNRKWRSISGFLVIIRVAKTTAKATRTKTKSEGVKCRLQVTVLTYRKCPCISRIHR